MQDSRAIYCAKLLAVYVDDPRNAVQIVRRVVVPRFVNNLVYDIRNAARRHDNAALRQATKRYAFLRPYMPWWQRAAFAAVAPMLWNWRSAILIRSILKRLRQNVQPPATDIAPQPS